MASQENSTNKCIYCGTPKQLCRSSHIVSRCLGTFENQPTLSRKVCKQCEQEIGKCEEVLAKCGPEALLLTNLGIKGRHKQSISPFRRKHAGHGPTGMTIEYPGTGYEMRVEPVGDGRNCQIVPHIVIIDAIGNAETIVLEDPGSLTAETLKELIFSTQIQNPVKVWPRMQHKHEVDRIFELLKECGLYKNEGMVGGIKSFEGIVKAEGQTTWDERRFRAIAKIAFHYYLNYNNFGHKGEEYLFEPLRNFIRYGHGSWDKFATENKGYFVEDFKRGWRPPSYGHIIVATANTRSVNVKIQLFVGPNYEPPYYEIVLCENPFGVEIPEKVFGHNYAYSENKEKQGYNGDMYELLATKLII